MEEREKKIVPLNLFSLWISSRNKEENIFLTLYVLPETRNAKWQINLELILFRVLMREPVDSICDAFFPF